MTRAREISELGDVLGVDGSNVGIGTTSPSEKLEVSGTGHTRIQVTAGTSSDAAIYLGDSGDADAGAVIYDNAPNALKFRANAAERMRIDSSGNLLIGKTSGPNFNTVGIDLTPLGEGQFTGDGRDVLTLTRKTSDGDIVTFRKDTTTVGSIYSRFGATLGINGGTTFTIGTNSSALDSIYFDFAGPPKAVYPNPDNTYDLGTSSKRFDDVYATNGTIQTSDQNEKQQIASLTDAEITAAKSISKLFKTFKWNDSVAEKGDAARTHTGVIAQEVEQAMTDAGLNAGDYAFFISTTWWETQTEVPAVEADEENGVEAQEAYTRTDTYETAEEAPEGATERNRKGIRYPQLLSFIGAATEQRLASIESRLDALESA